MVGHAEMWAIKDAAVMVFLYILLSVLRHDGGNGAGMLGLMKWTRDMNWERLELKVFELLPSGAEVSQEEVGPSGQM